MDQRRSPTAIIAILLLLLPALYVGSYLALIERFPPISQPTYHAVYRVGGIHAQYFYSPLNWLDRQLRPGYWEITDSPS